MAPHVYTYIHIYIYTRDVNESLRSETETRPYHIFTRPRRDRDVYFSGPRRDQDRDLASRDRDVVRDLLVRYRQYSDIFTLQRWQLAGIVSLCGFIRTTGSLHILLAGPREHYKI